MIRPPACPACGSDKPPSVNLIGPKGIPLHVPNLLAIAGSEDWLWDTTAKLGVTLELTCPACAHAYTWTRA